VSKIWPGHHASQKPAWTIDADEAALSQQAHAVLNDRNSSLDFRA
jgi:hypothetical protein